MAQEPQPQPQPTSSRSPEALLRKAIVEQKFGKGAYEKAAQARPHRCNGHLEDFMVTLTTWPLRDVSTTFNIFWQCMRSEPGKEPERQYKESIPYGAHLGEKRGMWWGRDEKNR